jgi:hypothetical protein
MKNKDMTAHFWKIYKCINSCTTKIQLESCNNMINTFKNNFSKVDLTIALCIFDSAIKYTIANKIIQ